MAISNTVLKFIIYTAVGVAVFWPLAEFMVDALDALDRAALMLRDAPKLP